MGTVGDAFLLPFEFEPSSQSEIARLFGESFGQHVAEAEAGRWVGPYDSGYGLHLVRVRERVPGRVAELAQVRDAVLREVLNERRQKALEAAYAKLRQRYTVEVEQPKPQVAEAR
jgi:parvulin-like peptidyl-prolyl isomerase